jgi:hypothetical protein
MASTPENFPDPFISVRLIHHEETLETPPLATTRV